MLKQSLVLIMLTLSALFSSVTLASEEDKNAGPTFAYYTLAPDITTNIYTKGKRLGYLQVRINLMVADSSYITELETHEPLIRDTIVEEIGQRTQEQVTTLAGREELRKQLMDKLNSLLVVETGKTLVADLLFTKYLYQ